MFKIYYCWEGCMQISFFLTRFFYSKYSNIWSIRNISIFFALSAWKYQIIFWVSTDVAAHSIFGPPYKKEENSWEFIFLDIRYKLRASSKALSIKNAKSVLDWITWQKFQNHRHAIMVSNSHFNVSMILKYLPTIPIMGLFMIPA